MLNTQYINLNMIPSGIMPVLYCSQYDVGRPLGFVVNNGSEIVDLDQYMVAIEGTRSDGTGIVADVNTDGNIGVFITTATMTNKSDIYDMQLVIRSTDTHRVASIPFMMHVRTAALDENSSVIEEDKSLFQQYTETVMIALAEIRSDVESEATARSNADSALLERINIEAADRAAEDTALNERINNIIAPGGAPSAAEVTDARLGADGVLYDTLGEAIRTQFEDVYKNLAYTVNLESDMTGLLVVNGGIGGSVPTSLTAKLEPQQTGSGAPSADNIRPFIHFTSLSMLHAGESGGGGSGNPPTTPFWGGTQNCITGEWTLYQYNSNYDGIGDMTDVRWWSDRDVYVPGTNPSVGAYVVYEPTTPMRESGQPWGAEAMYSGINQYKMLAYDSVTHTTVPFALTIETDVANVGDVIDGIAHDVDTLQSDMDQTNQALTLLRNEYDITASTVINHTTLIENNTEDIAENAQEISLVKSHLQDISNLFIYEQPSITKDSGLMLLPVAAGDSITIERIDGQTFLSATQLRFYDSDGVYIAYYSTIPTTATSRTFTYSGARDAAYIGITSIDANSGVYRVINNNSKSQLLAEINARKSADDTLTNSLGLLDEKAAKKDVVNRFNKATITEGVYVNPNNGTLETNADYFASDFIYVGDLTTVKVSYTHIVIWADENKHWIGHPDSMNSGNADLTYTIPANAEYIRFSAHNGNLNIAQVGENISRDHYVSHDVYTLPGLVIDESQITEGFGVVVAADGSGDYTSFTLAVKENYNNNKAITVMPGTYNIVAEYVAIWGQSAVDSMADADSATFDGWQYGVRMGGKKFTFMPGSHLVCDWTGHTVDGTHRFSALRVETDVEIIGLDLDCTATFYAIHDDYGTNVPYTVRYENCRVIGHNLVNADCIGGGCKKYSRHILKNCYFDNNLTNSATVRYHNTNAEGAEPEIYVSNCYFNNWFTPRWYGTQTSKMKVYVNNCEARSIHKMAESSSYNVDNVELYKWCNTETNPVT